MGFNSFLPHSFAMADWTRTIKAVERVRKKGEIYSMDGIDYFRGYRIIHRDSPVDPGVYIGQNQREAIVVDSAKYPRLRELYANAKSRASVEGKVIKDFVLRAVYNAVAEAMPRQGKNYVDSALKTIGFERPDVLVPLDVFISNGVGMCRHDALACAALLEMFRKEDHTEGKPSVDRNSDYLGGHA